jgi:hypothetical protein
LGLGILPIQSSDLIVCAVDDQEVPSMCWAENNLMHLTFMTCRVSPLMIVLAHILDAPLVTCTIDRTLLFNYRECNDAY